MPCIYTDGFLLLDIKTTGFIQLSKFFIIDLLLPLFLLVTISETLSFPWVHHSVVDLTFCFTEKIETTTHELSSFPPLIAHVRLHILQELISLPPPPCNFSLYSFYPGTFILMMGMFMAPELSFEPESFLLLL